MTVGERIRRARVVHQLSLNEVASEARISVATLSRIERGKQGLDLGLFLLLSRILKTSAKELIGSEPSEHVDPLASQIAHLNHSDRMQLWRDLAEQRQNRRKSLRLSEEVEELLAQLEFVRAEMESVRGGMRGR